MGQTCSGPWPGQATTSDPHLPSCSCPLFPPLPLMTMLLFVMKPWLLQQPQLRPSAVVATAITIHVSEGPVGAANNPNKCPTGSGCYSSHSWKATAMDTIRSVFCSCHQLCSWRVCDCFTDSIDSCALSVAAVHHVHTVRWTLRRFSYSLCTKWQNAGLDWIPSFLTFARCYPPPHYSRLMLKDCISLLYMLVSKECCSLHPVFESHSSHVHWMKPLSPL